MILKIRGRSGFTLIELMIVVGIIGLLASVVIPGFQNYLIKSKAAEAPIMISHITDLEAAYYDKPEYATDGSDLPSCLIWFDFQPVSGFPTLNQKQQMISNNPVGSNELGLNLPPTYFSYVFDSLYYPAPNTVVLTWYFCPPQRPNSSFSTGVGQGPGIQAFAYVGSYTSAGCGNFILANQTFSRDPGGRLLKSEILTVNSYEGNYDYSVNPSNPTQNCDASTSTD